MFTTLSSLCRRLPGKIWLLPLMVAILLTAGCGGREKSSGTGRYRADMEEMMPIPYTPRDDGQPLSSAELHAFKTVTEFDRNLSEEDAHIVELHFKFFVHQNRRTMERFIERSSRFLPHVRKVFSERGIPADVAYLFMVESGGNPNAISRAGAVGLWQFMPFTGRKFGLTQNSFVDERRDPFKATYSAADYLLKLYSDFSNWHLAVAAYNAGEGKVGRALGATGATDFFDLCRLDEGLDSRSRLKEETKDYVPRLIAVAKIMRNLRRLGFQEPTPDMAWNLSPLTVPPGTNLSGLARQLDFTWDEFSGMNPAFRRTASPPNMSATAYVPPDKLASAVNWVASAEARSFAGWTEYTVKKGDSLSSIAKRHRTSVAAIREANGFSNLPKRGSVILIPASGSAEPVYDALPQSASAPSASAGTYVVQSGDTLFALGRAWGTTPASIRLANRMGEKDSDLKPGRRISIPGDAKHPPRQSQPRSNTQSQAPRQSAPAVAGSGGSHTVQAGDTAFSIARRYGVSVQELCVANKLDPQKPVVRAGQRLSIPKGGTPAPRGGGGKVTVKPGDTLYSIARSRNVTVKALQEANNLGPASVVKPGQVLVVP